MKFSIYKPKAKTFDPSKVEFRNSDDFYGHMETVVKDLLLEADAVDEVRELYPDALAMPAPVAIGSGKFWALGIIAEVWTLRDPDAELPFVLFVIANPERERDKVAARNPHVWNRKLWKPPITQPVTSVLEMPVEIRSTDLDDPTRLIAKVGAAPDGRTTIYIELRGVEMAVTFADKVQVIRFDG